MNLVEETERWIEEERQGGLLHLDASSTALETLLRNWKDSAGHTDREALLYDVAEVIYRLQCFQKEVG